ncbi:hypothetical protein Tco_0728901 [Tanacetum coccineum]|uniref:Uncharacterized protein n=1 Tax=Tanacetum coccineum TaxID=301880 RepID=A0ABQ4YMW1_9ASTR
MLETTQTVSALKLPVLKTGDYDLWSMRMEQYLTHTDYAIWEVIVNGDAPAIASASTEGLDKTYDRFQKLISQLEIHGEVISQEDANLKLLKSLPLAWNNIALIMRNKSNLDTMSMDDLYNNLKVYEAEIKSQSSSSLNSQNVDFVSLENTSTSSSSYTDDVMFSFFVSQSNSQQLENKDPEQIDIDDLEEMDLKCHRRGHFAREYRAPRNQGNRNRDVSRRIVPVETPANALVVQDGIGSSSSSSSDSEADGPWLNGLIHGPCQMTENELHDIHKNNSEVFESASDSSVNEIEEENNQVNDRFKKVEGYHAVPPPYTGNYMPSRPDLSFARLDDSVYKTNVSETITSVPRNESTASKSSKDNLEQPKDVRPSAPIIEEWESDSDDDCVIRPSFEQNKPSYAKINFVKSDENTRKSVIKQHTNRQAETHRKSQILTKSSNVPVNTAKQSSSRAAISNSTARYVNTTASRPTVNSAKPSLNVFHKSHLLVKRTIYQRPAPKNNDFKEKVNTAKVNNVTTAGTKAVVSAVQGHEENAIKSLACWIWRPTGKVIDHISKDSRPYMPKRFDYVDR